MPNIRKGLMGAAGSGGAGNTVYIWGYGTHGQLAQGAGDTANKSSPVLVQGIAPVDMSSLNNTSFGLQANGTLYSWARNTSGALGRNIPESPAPYNFYSGGGTDAFVAVTGVQNFAKLADGCAFAGMHAIKTDGTLWAWGEGPNKYGPWGNNTQYSSPIQVGSLTDWLTPISAAGNSTAGCIKTDGTLWMWGRNSFNMMQNAAGAVPFSSPVQVGTQTHYSADLSKFARTFNQLTRIALA